MTDRFKQLIEKLRAEPRAMAAWEHFAKPLAATAFLSFFFFFIIYGKTENARVTDTFFVIYAFALPLAINCGLSFLDLPRQRRGAYYGASSVAVPFVVVAVLHLAGKYSLLPDFFRAFEDGGSFYLLYSMYAIFFVIGGVFIGLVEEFLFFDERKAFLKVPESAHLSKAKRRKMKKKKREAEKLSGAGKQMIDDLIGPDEEKGADAGGEDDGDDEDDEIDDEPPVPEKGGGTKPPAK